MGEAVYVWDRNKKLIFHNKAAEELNKLPSLALSGLSCHHIMGREGKGCAAFCPLIQVMDSGESMERVECELVRADGELRRVRVRINPLFKGEEVTGAISFMEDITEFHRLEENYLKNQKELKDTLEDLRKAHCNLEESRNFLVESQRVGKMGSWSWDGKSERAYCSEESFRLLGLPYDERGISLEEYFSAVHPDDRARVEQSLEDSFKGGGLFNETYRLLFPDGSIRIHNDQAEVKLNSEGEPEGIIGIHHDITDLRQTEEALVKREKLYRSILKTTRDGFHRANRAGQFLEVNEAYCRLLGYSEEELLNREIWDVEALETPDEMEVRRQSIRDEGYAQFETVLKRKDGSTVEVELIVQYRPEEDDFFCFTRDITEKNQIAEELKQARKMEALGSVAGGIAHDFNNLLTPVMGLAELLMEELPEESESWHKARDIFLASGRGANLVRQILAFSRKSHRRVSLIRLHPLMDEIQRLMRSAVPLSVDLHFDLEGDCGGIKADPTQIHQIVINMVNNAFHALENRSGRVCVELCEISVEPDSPLVGFLEEGRWARISVSDNGVGMSKEVMEKIFDPYFSTKGPGQGTGLGLAVVYGIVQEHGGEITVESELGEGTAFHVYLPVSEESVSEELPLLSGQ